MRQVRTGLLAIIVLMGCSTSGTPVEQGSPDADATVPDAQTEDAAQSPHDVARADEIAFVSDLGPGPDGPIDVVFSCAEGEGCFLDPCTENADCQSGWCVEHMGEGVCSQSCSEECPPGWSCKQVGASDPDLLFACVSNVANLCRPCATNADCTSTGGAEDACIDYGIGGNFCGGTCTEDDDCPWGFSCLEAKTVNGVTTQQCVADAGECPCTDRSVALGLATPCTVTNDFGTCNGQRVCTDAGLSECDAGEPAAESCNGLDDDCDGEVDEPTLVAGKYEELCDDDNPCTEDSCAGETGCVNEVVESGACDDADPCTVADHCETGTCVGEFVDCDDDNPCTEDTCTVTGGCDHAPAAGECDDGAPCTLGDHCVGGACQGTAINCECQTTADCGALEDGNQCNGTLVCDTAALPYQCVVDPETVVTCEPLGGSESECQVAQCIAATGQCEAVPANEGKLCNDQNPCTVNATCTDGTCDGGSAINCNDGNPCTDDACEAGGCVHTPNEAACDDGNACTLNDQCQAGKCVHTALVQCDDDNVCTTDSCSPDSGCLFLINTSPCDDGNVCTIGDKCHLGECLSSGQLNCTDNNPCSADACDPEVGCVFPPQEGDCDDGSACTTGDTCKNGLCIGTGFLACDDGDPCTDDACDVDSGCTHKHNAAPCDDNNPCTTIDVCGAGVCVGSGTLSCDDGNVCTDDICLPESGCEHVANVSVCDDGNACTEESVCAQGECVGSNPKVCDDGNLCTFEACDTVLGCVYTNNALPCDDNNICTDGDVCGGGECTPGEAVSCDDGVACTTDSCDPAEGCQHTTTPDCCSNGQIDAGEECDDGNLTPGDGCDANCKLEPKQVFTAVVNNQQYGYDGSLILGTIPAMPGKQIAIQRVGICGDADVDSGPKQFRASGGGVDFTWEAGQSQSGANYFLGYCPKTGSDPQNGFVYQNVSYQTGAGSGLTISISNNDDWDGNYCSDTDSEGNVYNDSNNNVSVRVWVLYSYL